MTKTEEELEANRLEQKAKKTLASYKIFHTKDGEAVLVDLFKNCNILTPTSSRDPLELAFREGARSVLFELLTLSKISMEELHAKFLKDYRNEGEE